MTSSEDKGSPPSKIDKPEDAEGVRDFLGRVSENLHELELDERSKEELKLHISTLEAQLASTVPKHSLVDEALEAMHRLLSSSTTQRATELLAEAGRFLTGVG